jgi:hypothetical protein
MQPRPGSPHSKKLEPFSPEHQHHSSTRSSPKYRPVPLWESIPSTLPVTFSAGSSPATIPHRRKKSFTPRAFVAGHDFSRTVKSPKEPRRYTPEVKK